MLLTLLEFPNSWELVDAQKKVFPQFNKFIQESAIESASVSFPSLLPFLSFIPFEVVILYTNIILQILQRISSFIPEFFSSLRRFVTTPTGDERDAKLALQSYLECLAFFLLKCRCIHLSIVLTIPEMYLQGDTNNWWRMHILRL